MGKRSEAQLDGQQETYCAARVAGIHEIRAWHSDLSGNWHKIDTIVSTMHAEHPVQQLLSIGGRHSGRGNLVP